MAARDAPPPLRAELERRIIALRDDTWRRVLGSIDTSRLRPGVTPEQAIETMTILGEGLDRRYVPRIAALPDRGFAQLEALTEEMWAHYERLRDGLYAPEPPASSAAPAAPLPAAAPPAPPAQPAATAPPAPRRSRRAQPRATHRRAGRGRARH